MIRQEEEDEDEEEIDDALFEDRLHGDFLQSLVASVRQGGGIGRREVGGAKLTLLDQLCRHTTLSDQLCRHTTPADQLCRHTTPIQSYGKTVNTRIAEIIAVSTLQVPLAVTQACSTAAGVHGVDVIEVLFLVVVDVRLAHDTRDKCGEK